MKKYVLSYSEFLEQYTFTTTENYYSMIKNARLIHRLSKRDGWNIDGILKAFNVNLDQVELVNC